MQYLPTQTNLLGWEPLEVAGVVELDHDVNRPQELPYFLEFLCVSTRDNQ